MKPPERKSEEVLDKFFDRLGRSEPRLEDVESAGDRVLGRLRSQGPDRREQIEASINPKSSTWNTRWPILAASGVGAAVLGIVVWVAFFPNAKDELPRNTPAVANTREIQVGDTVRTDNADVKDLSLPDGSRVEVGAHSDLSLESAPDGLRIRLDSGSVIVTAAKQGAGHLYVETRDYLVSVVGTVFLVKAADAGSRVAVIEGEVRVQQGATTTTLLPGQQVASNPSLEAIPVIDEFSWSRNAVVHLAMFQAAGAAGSPSIRQALGEIEVTVRDKVTGQVLGGSELTLIFVQPKMNIVTRTVADANGHMVFTKLQQGEYSLFAEYPGYLEERPGVPEDRQRLQIHVGESQLRHEVTLSMVRGTTVSGRILGPDGLPIPRVYVSMLRKTYRDGLPTLVSDLTGSGYFTGQTDERGDYRILAVPPADYLLEIEFRPAALAIFGMRREPQDRLPMVSYYPGVVESGRAVPVKVTGSQDLRLDVTLPRVPTYVISGKVINPLPGGQPLSNGSLDRGIDFELGPPDTSGPELPSNVVSRTVPNTAAAGETLFEISGLVPGSYNLYSLFAPGPEPGYVNRNYVIARLPIEVTDRDLEDLTIVLQPNTNVSGRILVDGNASDISWESVRVNLQVREHLPSFISTNFTGAVADPQTREFTIPNVPAAKVSVRVVGLPVDAYLDNVRAGSRSLREEGVFDVRNPMEGPLEITVKRGGGTIEGIAHRSRQEPAAGAGVVLVPSAPRRGNPALYKRVLADASGRFVFRGVSPGSYKIFAWTSLPEGRAEESPEFLGVYESGGQSITLNAGQTASVRVDVIPAENNR